MSAVDAVKNLSKQKARSRDHLSDDAVDKNHYSSYESYEQQPAKPNTELKTIGTTLMDHQNQKMSTPSRQDRRPANKSHSVAILESDH